MSQSAVRMMKRLPSYWLRRGMTQVLTAQDCAAPSRTFQSKADRQGSSQPSSGPPVDPLQDSSLGLGSRFKLALQQYGKVLIPVHLITSAAWFGSFYCAAMNGMDVVPFLKMVPGFPERVVDLLQNSHGGHAITAYTLYKVATPIRYTVSLGGTSLSVRYFRRHGYMTPPPPVREYLQDKMEETKEKLTSRKDTKEKGDKRK